jgi:CBS domain-containing protein
MKQSVSRITNHNLVCIYWGEKLEDAYRILTDKNIRHLPVVDHRSEIVGIISDRDFQRAMSIDQPDFSSGKAPQAEFNPLSRIRDFMSWPVESIDEKASVTAAAKRMIDKKYRPC